MENARGAETGAPALRDADRAAPRSGGGGSPPALEVDHVSLRYPGASSPALVDVVMRVEPGETTALLGANGAGKSTLLRIAAGLLRIDSGAARVCGMNVRSLERRALARLVALLPQNEPVPWGFRVREVVAMGRAPHQGAWMREGPQDQSAVRDAIERCDLARVADRVVETLSGGEQRRVAIARALAQKPRVLLLDEPAAFLDVSHRLMLLELLAALSVRDKVAAVVATHDLDAVPRFASRVVLMRHGRVLVSGVPAEVMTVERLRTAFGVEMAVGVHPAGGQSYFVPLRSSGDQRA